MDQRKSEPIGYIYFAGNRTLGMVKIGYSAANPDARLRVLQVGSPVRLERLGIVRGDREVEARLHDRFIDDRSHGEWFRLSANILAWIAANCEAWEEMPWRDLGTVVKPTVVPIEHRDISRLGSVAGLSPQALAARAARYDRLAREQEFALEFLRRRHGG